MEKELPAGDIVYLPPKYLISRESITAYGGELGQINKVGSMMIKSFSGTSYIHAESNLTYPDGKDFKVGDCVLALGESRLDTGAFAVFK